MRKITSISTLLIMLFLVVQPVGMVSADNEGAETGATPTRIPSRSIPLPDPLGGQTIPGLIRAIVEWVRNIAAPVAAGMIIFGAYQILFAAGDAEKIRTGRRTILYTVIGYAIIWIGWGITTIIQGAIG